MLEKFLKENLIAISIVQVLQIALAATKFESKALEVEVANLNAKVQEYTVKVSTLEQSNTALEDVIKANNERIEEQSKLQDQLAEQGQQAAALASKNSKVLGEQINLLKGKTPQGATECEKVLSVLQDL